MLLDDEFLFFIQFYTIFFALPTFFSCKFRRFVFYFRISLLLLLLLCMCCFFWFFSNLYEKKDWNLIVIDVELLLLILLLLLCSTLCFVATNWIFRLILLLTLIWIDRKIVHFFSASLFRSFSLFYLHRFVNRL